MCLKNEMSKKATIVHCLLDDRFGGPQNYAISVTKALEQEFNFLTISPGFTSKKNLRLIKLRRFFRFLFIIDIFINYLQIYYFFKRRNYKDNIFILHIHSYLNFSPLIFATLHRMPVLYHFHEASKNDFLTSIFCKFLSKSKLITFCHVSKTHASNIHGLNFKILPCFINNKHFNKKPNTSNLKQQTTYRNEAIEIVMIGNLNPVKDHFLALNALRDTKNKVTLNVIGAQLNTQRSYATKVFSEAEKIQKSNAKIKINFLGFRKQNEVATYLRKADVMLLTSKSEACPLVILEARKMGNFIVSTDVGDISQMLESYPRKTIIPIGSITSLKQAVKNLPAQNFYLKKPFNGSDEWSELIATRKISETYSAIVSNRIKRD